MPGESVIYPQNRVDICWNETEVYTEINRRLMITTKAMSCVCAFSYVVESEFHLTITLDFLTAYIWAYFRFIITARKRSLGQGNIFTPVCHSVHRGGSTWPGTPPGTRYTPPDQVHPPRTRYTPQTRYNPPGPGTPRVNSNFFNSNFFNSIFF